MRKKLFIFLFGCLLSLGILFQISGKEHVLSGVSAKTAFPTDMSGLLNGEYQSTLESYAGDNLTLKTWLVPVHNQILYSVFHTSPNEHVVIGKNDNLYIIEYILKSEQYVAPVSDEEITALITKLKTLNELLTAQGKSLFVFISPSKATIYNEDIPDIYKDMAPTKKTSSNYERFLSELQQTDIPYYDTIPVVKQLKEESPYPVYPSTGIHWSKVTACDITALLTDEMEAQLGVNFPEMEVTYQPSLIPSAPDADLCDLMNLMYNTKTDYYAPGITITEPEKDSLSIVARGGSFMGTTVYEMINQRFFDNFLYMENTLSDLNGSVAYFTSYDELDIAGQLANADILLLEVQEKDIADMSFGFIDYILDNRLLQ